MELTQLNEELYNASQRILKAPTEIKRAAEERIKYQAEYDKQLALTMVELKEKHPATLIEKLAKGELAELREKLEIAEAKEDYAVNLFKALQTEISSLQSIIKIQSEV
jgi:predicted nuclease with RNAse H fold